ncbi:MAG TPA: hypothetical protein VN781_07945 [Acidimicrobiales bacterium]|nr:hypothetical protein [Acidimicrobiales bacterium]
MSTMCQRGPNGLLCGPNGFQQGFAFHRGPGVLGWLLLAFLAALVILGVLALVRLWVHPHGPAPFHPGMVAGPHGPPGDPALGELRLRYARGDITWDEYSSRARNLGYPIPPGEAPPTPPAPPTAP